MTDTTEVITTPLINLTVNEITNGMWAVAAGILLLILVRYIWRVRRFNIKQGHTKWWNDTGVVFGGAMAVMVLGHFIQATSRWFEYVQFREGDTDSVFASIWIIIPSMVIVILGKMLVFWAFTPMRYRKCIVGSAIAGIISIPFLVWMFLR